MKEKELKNILRKNFNFEANWKPLFSLLFSKVQYFSNPSNPFSENEKVKSGKQTGIVKLDDGKSIAIFEVEVDDSIRIDRNRHGLREIAIKHIDQNITHGAFVFFYSKNQADYRFSFIAKWSELDHDTGEFKKGETKPKRYTYLLGDNEACTTAAKRLLILVEKKDNQNTGIKEIIDAFSVESLNKEFFKTYKEQYEKFWRFIASNDNGYRDILLDKDITKEVEKREKPIRDFAKKLLGRIVFLHFLQKKGWMGCSANTKKWENGEKQFMQQLFADFSYKTRFHSQCLTKLFFSTLNTRRPNDVFEIKGLSGKLNGSRVPYLNGGLFDTDKPEEVLKIDFPEKYFAELLEFFEQYNFTIDENSPDDHEVGIDPEMLGHIFENLLEENREKGAFYTPKEVVQYMCKESIVQYLSNSFEAKTDIEKFVRNHIVSATLAIKDNAVLLNHLLDEIKVCDPAIGSGAFPIGILQEIFEAKKFIYPYLKTNKEFNPAQVKKDIIQKSIYGVDLEKGAVDIAQLRFWLALVVDEENPHPLPNLDYKIMQGNSLLESFEGIDLSKAALFDEPKVRIIEPDLFREPEANYGFSDKNRNDIKKLIQTYFTTEDKLEKAEIRKQIDKIVTEHIDKSLEGFENQLLIEIASLETSLRRNKELLRKTDKIEKEIEKRQKLLEKKGEARKKLLAFEYTEERPYFLWHLFFMDVFEKEGFDIIIGNPPYIQLQKDGGFLAQMYENKGFETFERTGDIYSLFYEKGVNLLKNNGILTYITSNKWMRTDYGKSLRRFFTKLNPILLIDLGANVFHSATVDTNILILNKTPNQSQLKGISIKNHTGLASDIKKSSLPIEMFEDDIWTVLSKEDFLIKKIIEEGNPILSKWPIEFNYGIKTGLTEAFLLTKDERNRLLELDKKNSEIIVPVVRGKDLDKFKIKYKNYYLLNTHNGVKEFNVPRIEIADYPIIETYLKSFGNKLTTRADQGDKPFNLRNCAYLLEFEKPKIIYQEIVQKPSFAYDANGKYYCLDTARIITGEKLKYLLTILNSNLFFFSIKKFYGGGGLGNTGIRMKHTFFNKFPAPIIENMYPFEILADYLILLNDPTTPQILEHASNEIISQNFEEVLNMMVYELYFEEHLKEKEIDVLQFVDFPDISKMEIFEEKRDATQKIYFWLKEKDNPIRNRILVSESRSWIIKRINQSTH